MTFGSEQSFGMDKSVRCGSQFFGSLKKTGNQDTTGWKH